MATAGPHVLGQSFVGRLTTIVATILFPGGNTSILQAWKTSQQPGQAGFVAANVSGVSSGQGFAQVASVTRVTTGVYNISLSAPWQALAGVYFSFGSAAATAGVSVPPTGVTEVAATCYFGQVSWSNTNVTGAVVGTVPAKQIQVLLYSDVATLADPLSTEIVQIHIDLLGSNAI